MLYPALGDEALLQSAMVLVLVCHRVALRSTGMPLPRTAGPHSETTYAVMRCSVGANRYFAKKVVKCSIMLLK